MKLKYQREILQKYVSFSARCVRFMIVYFAAGNRMHNCQMFYWKGSKLWLMFQFVFSSVFNIFVDEIHVYFWTSFHVCKLQNVQKKFKQISLVRALHGQILENKENRLPWLCPQFRCVVLSILRFPLSYPHRMANGEKVKLNFELLLSSSPNEKLSI